MIFGKIKNFFADLKAVAFTGSYSDLSHTPVLGTLAAKSTVEKNDLSSDIQTSLEKADTAVQTETDPTVPNWAKRPSKPSYSYSEIKNKPSSYTPSAHKHSADDINSGILPIIRGGTGANTATGARTNLGSAPMYTYGTTDLTAGTSELATGTLYFLYE